MLNYILRLGNLLTHHEEPYVPGPPGYPGGQPPKPSPPPFITNNNQAVRHISPMMIQVILISLC